jgi:NTE family protein
MKKMAKAKKIGLALSGGGARGLAHIGVIKALQEANIPISCIAGTSMGAVVGAWFALHGEVDSLDKIFREIKPRDVSSLFKVLRRRDGLILKGRSVNDWIKDAFDRKKIEDCPIPFACVAAKVKNGEEKIFDQGNLAEAVGASVAIPIIFNPVEVNGELLMDGGAVNPIPVDVVKKMGADFIIAAEVSGHWVDVSEMPLDVAHLGNLFSLISGALSAATYQMSRGILKQADVVIDPSISSFNLFDFDKAGELVRLGFYETKRMLPEICRGCGCPVPEKNTFDKILDFLLAKD